MSLQEVMARHVDSLGDLPFEKFRAFHNEVRSSDKPYRFVDGELIEQFLNCDSAEQEEILAEVGSDVGDLGTLDVEEVKKMIEALRRLH